MYVDIWYRGVKKFSQLVLVQTNIFLFSIHRLWKLIRNNGRQAFLSNPPSNFSRIVHDYTDECKGYMVWKDMLEERVL
jgi:hypothetical protein